MKESMTKGGAKKLLGGSMLLSAAAVISKLIGMFYKIPLIKYVGLEGMAYFLAANHIYIFLFVISTSGLPVAVSIMVAEATVMGERQGADSVFKAALRIFLIIGGIGSIIMLVAASPIAEIIAIGGAARSIAAISPAILLACVSGAFRGYFQGRGIMHHTAVSQVIESVGKLVLGLAGAIYALGCGFKSETVAAFAIAGITAGVAIATLYLAVAKKVFDAREDKRVPGARQNAPQSEPQSMSHGASRKVPKNEPLDAPRVMQNTRPKSAKTSISRGVTKRLISIALPITLSSALLSISGLIDTSLIANCLGAAGFSESMINKLYSSYGNIAMPLFSLTPTLITPVAMAAVPLVSGAYKSGDIAGVEKIGNSAIRLTLLASIPAAAGLSAFSGQIISLIFPKVIEGGMIATPLLSILAVAIIPTCLINTTNALLQACGRSGVTIISMSAGASVKLLLELLLLRLPEVNIAGAPISTFACGVTVLCFNICFLSKILPGLSAGNVIATSVSALAAVGGAVAVWMFSGGIDHHIIRMSLSIGTAVLLYVILALVTRAIDSDILNMLPGGEKLAARLGVSKKGRAHERHASGQL